MRLTKIICTLGPTSSTDEQLEALARKGMNIARLNFSHGTWETHKKTIGQLKKLNEKLAKEGGLPSCVGILLDTQGAEIRTGDLAEPMAIAKDEEVVFSSAPVQDDKRKNVIVNYADFGKDVKQAERILLDNGELSFELVDVRKDGTVVARANENGKIGSRRHVNLPGASISLPSLTKKDWEDIEHGSEEGLDFVGLSFIRAASEVEEVREFLRKKGRHMELIPKIETREAVKDIDAIIRASDGIMVARGDLGAEVPFERIPVIQDYLVGQCKKLGKPVIVATHMLESMIKNPMPTRAEVTDIAHAASTRTDCTMLSAETANGAHPLGSLDAMARVLAETETYCNQEHPMERTGAETEREARAEAAVNLAVTTDGIAAMIVMTKTGRTVREVAKFRPKVPVIAFTPDPSIQRRLQISYGVIPLLVQFDKDPEQAVVQALKLATTMKLLKKGDKVVLLSDAKAMETNVSSIQVRVID